jgi:hypothetical protein
MNWYETKTCAVCGKTIRRRFWQQGPRLVGPGHDVRYGDHFTEAEVEQLLATHRVVCASCFYDRLNEVFALVERGNRADWARRAEPAPTACRRRSN